MVYTATGKTFFTRLGLSLEILARQLFKKNEVEAMLNLEKNRPFGFTVPNLLKRKKKEINKVHVQKIEDLG